MVTPLWILAAATIGVGFLGFPVVGVFKHWITVPGHEHPGFSSFYNVVLPVGSVALALFAVYIGWQLWAKNRWRYDVLAGPFAWAYRFVENKYYLDDIYMGYIVRPIQYTLSKAAYWSNQHVLDGVVNGTARGTIGTAKVTYEVLDQEVVDFAVNGAAGITGLTGGLLRYIQSGQVQRYAAVLFASIAAFVALFVILG
jgi:NADH-quinone oxidoreductase subunit L